MAPSFLSIISCNKQWLMSSQSVIRRPPKIWKINPKRLFCLKPVFVLQPCNLCGIIFVHKIADRKRFGLRASGRCTAREKISLLDKVIKCNKMLAVLVRCNNLLSPGVSPGTTFTQASSVNTFQWFIWNEPRDRISIAGPHKIIEPIRGSEWGLVFRVIWP